MPIDQNRDENLGENKKAISFDGLWMGRKVSTMELINDRQFLINNSDAGWMTKANDPTGMIDSRDVDVIPNGKWYIIFGIDYDLHRWFVNLVPVTTNRILMIVTDIVSIISRTVVSNSENDRGPDRKMKNDNGNVDWRPV